MNLIKRKKDYWSPVELLSDFQDDLNHFFDRPLTSNALAREWNPAVEVKEEKDKYSVHFDIPGVKKEDFSVTVDGNYLIVKGKRNEEKNTEEKGYSYSERFYGSFSRSIQLPTEIDAGKIKAAYKNGVLQIEVPKSENAKPKQIDVQVS